MAIKADRGGSTSNSWYQENIPVSALPDQNNLALWLELDSKGGGVTQIRITVETDSYEEIISVMLDADFDKTVRAFASASQKWRRKNIKKMGT